MSDISLKQSSVQSSDKSIEAFFALLRAGLWEQGVRLLPFEGMAFPDVLRIAQGQCVAGLVAAGLEHVEDLKVPRQVAVAFMQEVFPLEQLNADMNGFIARLFEKMKQAGVASALVKGQGIARCYVRPLWRNCGDVDLFFDADGYERAKALLVPLAETVDRESPQALHLGMSIRGWSVELHGTLHAGIEARIDRRLDALRDKMFGDGAFRFWADGQTAVALPSPDFDAVFIFCHILQHFFKGGIGLRQICDWCRLLWTYRDGIDRALLEQRLREMGLLRTWRAFAALAVDSLGMPPEAMPLYDPSPRWQRKARRIRTFILRVGNFGHNRDMSYFARRPYLVRKAISLGRRLSDFAGHLRIFPLDTLRFLPRVLLNGFRAAAQGQ